MSRRGILVIVVITGALLAAVLFLRSNSQDVASVTSTETVESKMPRKNSLDDTEVGTSAISETTSSSSTPALVGPGRGPRSGGRPLGGKKSYNIQGAVVHDDPLFAGTSWKIWSGVVASPKPSGEPTTGKILGEVNGYYLVDEGVDAHSENFDAAKPFVVLREEDGTAGVVTGNFAVVLEDGASADFLIQSTQLKIVSAFPNIQTYYVTSSQSPFNLKALQEELKQAPEVKEVKMEILDRQYEKF